jgi:sensor histidine kinase YesM
MGLVLKLSAVLPDSKDRIQQTFFTILTIYTSHLLITWNYARLMIDQGAAYAKLTGLAVKHINNQGWVLSSSSHYGWVIVLVSKTCN